MVDADLLGHRLKWEPARGGALFPHLYGQLDTAAAIWVRDLREDKQPDEVVRETETTRWPRARRTKP